MKDGWKTTEFWGMAITAIIGLVNQGMGLNLPVEALAAVAIAVAGYAISRGLAKQNS